MLKNKFSKHKKEVSPFLPQGSDIKNLAELVKEDEKYFNKEIDKINNEELKKRVFDTKKAKKINKNIDYKRFNRDRTFQGNNCCYYPISKYIDEEILPSEYVSNTMRTRTIMD